MAEVEDGFDDAGRELLAVLLRQAYLMGCTDGEAGYEPNLTEYWRCEPWRWGRFPEHDKLPLGTAQADDVT